MNLYRVNHGYPLVAIDLETTGVDPERHSVVQVAAVPVGRDLRPADTTYMSYVKPEGEFDQLALDVNGIDFATVEHWPTQQDAADDFCEWLGSFGPVVPLAHNWGFESRFLRTWLGDALDIATQYARDTMLLASLVNDLSHAAGVGIPFPSVSLESLVARFGLVNPAAHNALADAIAEIELYRKLLEIFDANTPAKAK